MIDETIIRDLQRMVNDREVPQRHRNVARRAAEIFAKLASGDEAYDSEKTDFKANSEALKAREAQQLIFMEGK